MSVRIVAIKKSNGDHYDPYEAISEYKWIDEGTGKTGITHRQALVDWVKKGGRAYVSSQEGTVDCFVNRSASGTEFLQTNADRQSSNNLLNLPEIGA